MLQHPFYAVNIFLIQFYCTMCQKMVQMECLVSCVKLLTFFGTMRISDEAIISKYFLKQG